MRHKNSSVPVDPQTHGGAQFQRNALAFAIAAAFGAPASLLAQTLPTGGSVVGGASQGAISQPNATTMQIDQFGNRVIYNFGTFSIGSGYSVVVNQPSAASVGLARVTGNTPSEIFGRLSANGQFYLTNAAGVYIRPGASIDVGGFIATTLSITDSDFMASRNVFTNAGNAGSVVNQGTITALNGYVGLFAPNVINEGVIAARMGTVALAAGDKVTLDMVGDGLIKVSVDQAALNAAAMNRGTIEADGGNVILTARSANALLDTVINTDGVIRANSIGNRNGTITLDGGGKGIVSVSGTLEAKGNDAGTTGGTVKVLGEYVGVGLAGTTASINASGDAGGGTILIGGNFQGHGPEANAAQTIVGRGAAINADAVTEGNGGKVIVWADGTTNFYGNISARGGAQSGDGGFAEVSGKNALAMRGDVDLRAPHGRIGTLLLDPASIEIVGGSGDGSTLLNGGDGTNDGTATFTGNPSGVAGAIGSGDTSPSKVFETEIEGLNANISLSATTSIFTSGTFGGALVQVKSGNNLLMNAPSINLTGSVDGVLLEFATKGGGTIQLTAGGATGTITVGKLTSAGAGGTITLTSGKDITVKTSVDSGLDTVTFNFGQTAGGTLDLSSATSISGTTVSAVGGAGTDTIKANGTTWTLTGSNAGNIAFGSLGFTAIENLSDTGGGLLKDTGTWTLTGSNTGSVTNLTGTFAGMANLSDTAGTGLLKDTSSTWTLTGSNKGSVTNLTGTFTGMANLSDTGSGLLKDTGSTWTLTGSNTGSVTNLTGTFTGMANLSDTGSGLLKDTDSTWTLTGSNTGSVTNLTGTFAGMANLTDLGVGYFNMNTGGSVSGGIVSAFSTSTLDYSGRATPVLLNLAGSTATDIGTTFAGITTVKGSSAIDTVTGATQTYNLTGANAGNNTSTIFWTSFENLTDTGTGTFNVATGATLSGAINGGLNGNLRYVPHSGPISLNVSTNIATGITGALVNIRNVTGSAANDTVLGASQSWVLTGAGAGNNGLGAGKYAWTSFENLTATGATTISGAGGLRNLTSLGTTTLSGTIGTLGNQSYGGAVTLAGATSLTSAGAVTFGNTVSGPNKILTITTGVNFNVANAINLCSGPLAGCTGALSINAASFSGGGSLTSGALALKSTGAVINPLEIHSKTLAVDGFPGQWVFPFPSEVTTNSVTGPPNIAVSIGGSSLTVTAKEIQAAESVSTVAAGAVAVAADVASKAFATDSVAEQIEFGFAGDVGTLPPMDHRLQGVGIAVPKCFNESREGETC